MEKPGPICAKKPLVKKEGRGRQKNTKNKEREKKKNPDDDCVVSDPESDVEPPPKESNKPEGGKDDNYVKLEEAFVSSINIEAQGQLPKDSARIDGVQPNHLEYLTDFAFSQ